MRTQIKTLKCVCVCVCVCVNLRRQRGPQCPGQHSDWTTDLTQVRLHPLSSTSFLPSFTTYLNTPANHKASYIGSSQSQRMLYLVRPITKHLILGAANHKACYIWCGQSQRMLHLVRPITTKVISGAANHIHATSGAAKTRSMLYLVRPITTHAL